MVKRNSQIAKELLQHLALPPGTANVTYRRQVEKGTLVVEYSPTARFSRSDKPSVYQNIPVRYIVRRPVRAFA